MNKSQLKNCLVELNSQGIISDKEVVDLNNRLEEHFKKKTDLTYCKRGNIGPWCDTCSPKTKVICIAYTHLDRTHL